MINSLMNAYNNNNKKSLCTIIKIKFEIKFLINQRRMGWNERCAY